jgi:hypothetical protein
MRVLVFFSLFLATTGGFALPETLEETGIALVERLLAEKEPSP